MRTSIEIKKVRKQGETKIVCIPQKSDIQVGDFVKIIKINLEAQPTN